MVEATDLANRDDLAEFRPFNRAAVGRILVEREVSTRPVVVREVASQGAAQVPFAKNGDVIQPLAQAGDGALSDVDSQHLQFAMDSRRAPERIGLSHSDDESPDLGAYARAARRGARGESGPILAEATALPPQDGVG